MRRRISVKTSSLVALIILITGSLGPVQGQQVLSASRSNQLASPDGRLLIGRGEDYVASSIPEPVLSAKLRDSMKERRDFAWTAVERLLKPIRIRLLDGVTEVDVPLWHTWYEGQGTETQQVLELYFRKLKPVLAANPNADVEPVIAETMKEFSQKDLSTALTDSRFTRVLLQHQDTQKPGDLLGRGGTMFSPSFVEHVMRDARGIDECTRDVATVDRDPPSSTEFSWCIKEFPRSSVMIKTTWVPLKDGVPTHDTSAVAMTALIRDGTWPGDGHPSKTPPIARPDQSQIYSVVTAEDGAFGLAGIHFVTKDVREWVWITLWWDAKSSSDFGADRPPSIDQFNNGVWKNYKMCVASAFSEGDAAPWSQYTGVQGTLGDSVRATYEAIRDQLKGAQTAVGIPAGIQLLPTANGPWPPPHDVVTTWCSNPTVETHAGNGRTNCIGCHQIVLTQNEHRKVPATFRHTLVGDYPQFGRSKDRKNFSGEFSWAFEFEFMPGIGSAKKAAQFSWPPR